jgi:WD40 repeat protein
LAYGPTGDTLALGCIHLDGEAPVMLAALSPGGDITFQRLGAHATDNRSLAFTPDGGRLITGSGRTSSGVAELKCWDVKHSFGLLWEIPFPSSVSAIATSPDGTRLIVGGVDGRLRLISMERPSETLAETAVESAVASIAFARTKPFIVVTQATERVSLIQLAHRAFGPRIQYNEPGASLSSVALSRDDKTLYVKGEGGVQCRDVRTMKPLYPAFLFPDLLRSFTLTSRPEAVVVVTDTGKLIQRIIPNVGSQN